MAVLRGQIGCMAPAWRQGAGDDGRSSMVVASDGRPSALSAWRRRGAVELTNVGIASPHFHAQPEQELS